MKRIAILIISNLSVASVFGQQENDKKDSIISLDPVEVVATRAGLHAPFTKTNLTKTDLQKVNQGQDLPFLLNQTPSVVINSDAGNGIGYTGIRIRGTDASRINVTLNGIPFNDPESQGTFFVDLPDFSSSVNSIQVQRGVGTSSNGAGAFGATINISTNELAENPYLEVNNSFGSFNSWKNTIKAGSGLVADHFTTDLRLSNISSDGYVDRATSKLQSYYLSSAYINNKTTLRFTTFSGKEKTYQAWYGVSEDDLKTNRTINYAGMEKPGDPYDNQTDNYTQTHYQLFLNQHLNNKWKLSTGFFYVKGKGYYEEYKADRNYADYGLPEPVYGGTTVTSTDLVRQLWLDNDFYGQVFSLFYKSYKNQLTLGGGWSRYEGNHFGEVIWAGNGLSSTSPRWYNHDAFKNDLNLYLKDQFRIDDHWNGFIDLQFRNIQYSINGFRDNPSVKIDENYTFLNPKTGISYTHPSGWSGYLSYSRGQKEPNRDDFEAGAGQLPKPEKLNDFEASISRKTGRFNWEATGYYMAYKDQLVLTGKINDVGAYTRTNIPDSYRLGIELVAGTTLTNWFTVTGNLSLSKNKVKNFSEYVDDYDAGGQKTYSYKSTDIAYSPAVVGACQFTFIPVKKIELALLSKYVGKQYLDNTQNENRKLNAYYLQDFRLIYYPGKGLLKHTSIAGQVNNLFNRKYEPNGYTYSYVYGGQLTTENYYYPMAGTNFTLSVNIRLQN